MSLTSCSGQKWMSIMSYNTYINININIFYVFLTCFLECFQISDFCCYQCSICQGLGFYPPLVPLNPQVFIDPQKIVKNTLLTWFYHESSTGCYYYYSLLTYNIASLIFFNVSSKNICIPEMMVSNLDLPRIRNLTI